MQPVYEIHIPSAPLAGLVESIWVQAGGDDPAAPPTTVLPSGRVELIFHFGDPFVDCGAGPAQMPSLHVVGQRTSPLRVRASGKTGLVVVRLRPGAAGAFFGGRAAELRDRVVALEALYPDGSVRDLAAALRLAASNRHRIALVEAFLGRQATSRDGDPLVSAVIAVMNTGWGGDRVAALAGRFGSSERQLARRFAAAAGTSPKRLMRVIRSQKAIACLRADLPAADVVALCGYADQSHLIHDVAAHSGRRPTELRHSRASGLQRFFNVADTGRYCGAAYL